MEGIGGTFNASTDRESTVYYVRVPARHAALAMTVLGELVARPLLDEKEIEQERDVIVEEIRSYLDDPAEHVNVLFDLAVFDDTPLGREIAGTEETVRALPADAIHRFWRRTTGPANVVVGASGDIAHADLVDMAGVAFGTGNGPSPPTPRRRRSRPASASCGPPGPRRRRSWSSACRACGATIPTSGRSRFSTRFSGDGMSSRLFLEVREERGLAYDVGSSIVSYADAGRRVGLRRRRSGQDPADDRRRPRGARSPAGRAGARCRDREGEGIPRRAT